MRKATGKVVSLVLALALVVTSFSSTFAFAATKSEFTDDVHANDDTVYLANLSNYADSNDELQKARSEGKNLFNISEWVNANNSAWLETYDHIRVTDELEISSVSVSGDNIIRVTKVTESNLSDYSKVAKEGDYVATVRDAKSTGTATVKVLFTAKTTERGEDELTVRGSMSFKVVLLDAMTPVLTSNDWEDGLDNLQKNPQYSANTQSIPGLDTSKYKYEYYAYETEKNAADSGYHKVYDTGKPVTYDTANLVFPRATGSDAQADEVPVKNVILANDDKNYKDFASGLPTDKDDLQDELNNTFIVSATGTNNYLEGITSGGNDIRYGVAKPSAGNTVRLTVSSVKVEKDNDDKIVNIATSKVVTQETAKVENRVKGNISSVDLGDGSQQQIGLNKNTAVLSKSKAYVQLEDNIYWDVTGADIVSTTGVDVSGGKIGNLTAKGYEVTISNGTVGDIKAGDVNLVGGSVDSVDASGSVVVSGATVAKIAGAKDVKISEGKVTGDVTATHDVSLEPLNEEVEVSIGGTVKAEQLTVDGTVGKASVGGYFAVEDTEEENPVQTDSKLLLKGDKASINKIDVDYRPTEILLDSFQGTVPAPVNAKYTGYSETVPVLKSDDTDDYYGETRATVNGALNIYTIELNSGMVTFNGKVNVNNVYGSDADMVINAGQLYISDSVATSNTLRLANAADVAVGTVVYSASSDIADEDSFIGYGYSVKAVSGTNSDSFVIDGVSFSGLSMSQSTAEVVVGDSITLTASAYPNGTALPANTKIKFYIDSDESYISGLNNGDGTATVTAKAYSTDFSVLNKATVTAVVVDEFDIDLEEYGVATCVVTVIPEIKSTYTSDTTGNVYVKAGDTYQFKITSLDGKVPTFGIGSPSFKLVAQSSQGNDHYFKVQAVGNIGDACGVYINSDPNKVAVLHVTADYTCDTTTVNVAVGASYQVKITANARPTVAAGNSIYTVEYVSNSGNDYFFKITATQNAKAGDVVGFYVNGGPRAFVATTV